MEERPRVFLLRIFNGGLTAFICVPASFSSSRFSVRTRSPAFHPLTCVNWHGSATLLL